MTPRANDSTTPAEAGLTRRVALAAAAGLVGVGLVDAVDAGAQTDEATAAAEEPSLYDRLGGIFAISAVVDRFSDGSLPTRNSTSIRRSRRGMRTRPRHVCRG